MMIYTLLHFVIDIKIPKTTLYNAVILVKKDGMDDGSGICNRTSTCRN